MRPLDSLRRCFEGAVPSVIATCATDGTPNITYVSHVHYVDNKHVALSFQFFNKTRQNVLSNPHAIVQVVDPDTAAQYHLTLIYLRTETSGPLFEYMKARLAGIASHTGMSKVFKLEGADIYRVDEIATANPELLIPKTQTHSRLSAVRACCQRVMESNDLAGVLDNLLLCLETDFSIHYSMVLMFDEARQSLYTLSSRGYVESGVGAEVKYGEGIIGVAARERTPIRIGYMAREYLYGRAVRQQISESDSAQELETEIPFAGIPESRSQLAVPIIYRKNLLGVLYVESAEDRRFDFDDEDALVTLASNAASAIALLSNSSEQNEDEHTLVPSIAVSGKAVSVRRYAADDSIFIDGDYLIKGVAGSIFWKLLRDFVNDRRNEFTNRELRLDPSIGLPEIGDNLEARLILLQKRLNERCPFIAIKKTGRGRFRLESQRPIQLDEVVGARK